LTHPRDHFSLPLCAPPCYAIVSLLLVLPLLLSLLLRWPSVCS
jgi:hypothetical protein